MNTDKNKYWEKDLQVIVACGREGPRNEVATAERYAMPRNRYWLLICLKNYWVHNIPVRITF
jgi:hypothetical protein